MRFLRVPLVFLLAADAALAADFVILGPDRFAAESSAGLHGRTVASRVECNSTHSVLLTTMLPVAPVGLGVGHVAFLTLFQLAGSREGANLFSLCTAVVILWSLAGGLFYLGHRDRVS